MEIAHKVTGILIKSRAKYSSHQLLECWQSPVNISFELCWLDEFSRGSKLFTFLSEQNLSFQIFKAAYNIYVNCVAYIFIEKHEIFELPWCIYVYEEIFNVSRKLIYKSDLRKSFPERCICLIKKKNPTDVGTLFVKTMSLNIFREKLSSHS